MLKKRNFSFLIANIITVLKEHTVLYESVCNLKKKLNFASSDGHHRIHLVFVYQPGPEGRAGEKGAKVIFRSFSVI